MGRSFVGSLACIVLLASIGCDQHTPTAPAPSPAGLGALFLTPNGAELPVGGGTVAIAVVTSATPANGGIAPNVDVTLTTTGGTLSASTVRTDNTGRAAVTWTGTSSALITARAEGLLATAAIDVATPTPPPNPTPTPTPTPQPNPDPTPPPQPPPAPRAPILSIGASWDQATPRVLAFTARLTSNGNSLPASMTVSWDFNGDGAIDATTSGPVTRDQQPPFSYAHDVSYTYGAAGTYTVRATAVTSDGETLTATLPVTVGG